jgi:hypothetical protein
MSFAVAPTLRRGRASPKGYAQLLLPSSLNHCRPLALVFSTSAPVSVCGTDKNTFLNETFPESRTIYIARGLRFGLPHFLIKRENGFTNNHYFEA